MCFRFVYQCLMPVLEPAENFRAQEPIDTKLLNKSVCYIDIVEQEYGTG